MCVGKKEERRMSCSFVSSGEVSERFDSVMNELAESGATCFITDGGKPRAVILDVDRYHAMMDIIEAQESDASGDLDMDLIRSMLKAKPDA